HRVLLSFPTRRSPICETCSALSTFRLLRNSLNISATDIMTSLLIYRWVRVITVAITSSDFSISAMNFGIGLLITSDLFSDFDGRSEEHTSELQSRENL